MSTRGILLAISLSALAACSDPDSGPPALAQLDASPARDAGDAGSKPEEPPEGDASVPATGCVDLSPAAAADVAVETVQGSPPSGTGGVVAPGDYELSASTYYVVKGNPKPAPAVRKGVLRLTASELTVAVNPPAAGVRAITFAYQVSGTDLLVTPKCVFDESGASTAVDGGAASPLPFSATATTIAFAGARNTTSTTGADGGTVVTAEGIEYYTFTQ